MPTPQSDSTLEIHDGSRAVRVTTRMAGTDTVLDVRLLQPRAAAVGRLRRQRQDQVLLGDARLPLEGPARPLVRAADSGHELLIGESMHGRVHLRGGEALDLQQLGPAWRVLPDARVELEVGPYAVQILSEPPPRRLRPRALFGFIGPRDRACHAGSFALHAVVLTLAVLVPPSAHTLSRDRFDPQRARVPEQPVRLRMLGTWVRVAPQRFTAQEGSGGRASGEEGRMGQPLARRDSSGLFALRGPVNNPDPHLARRLSRALAQNAGVLQLLGGASSASLASVSGRESAVGSDAETALGALVGNLIGESYGVGGLGLVGTGRGGGARDDSEHVGIGSLGTVGRGGGVGQGAGVGRGVGQVVGYSAGVPTVVAGRAQVRGGLDKTIIRRVVRRHINEWRYCYEKELCASPNLSGRIIVSFTIASTGEVVSSRVASSTVGNRKVEQCVAHAVRRWRFPQAKCGGIVMVNYPLVVRVAGQ